MVRRVRRFMPSPAMVVALTALVTSLGGSAYALVVTGKTIRNNSVTGFDIRRAAWEQIASLGGRPLELDFIPDAEAEGGYARPLTEEENERLRQELRGLLACQVDAAQLGDRIVPEAAEDPLVEAGRPLALLALKPGFDRIRARFDYERYGGAPLLGVRGVSIVSHGRARARMMEHAIRVASESANARVPELITQWTRDHPALVHRGVRSRIAARLHRERGS